MEAILVLTEGLLARQCLRCLEVQCKDKRNMKREEREALSVV